MNLMILSSFLSSCSTYQFDNSLLIEINQHDEAANFLMLVSDQDKDLKETCQITSSEALGLIQPLHAMIDKDISKGPLVLTTDLEASCIVNCHCGIYADLAQNKAMKESLFRKAQEMPRKALIACAERTAKWFCSSKLLEELKLEMKTDSSVTPNAP